MRTNNVLLLPGYTRLRTHKGDSGADGSLIQGLRRETVDGSRPLLAERGAVRTARAVSSDRHAREAAGGRPSRHQRHRSCPHLWRAMENAPAAYGPRKTLYNRFRRWAAKDIWSNIFYALAATGGSPAVLLIDSSAVRAHRCASGGKGGSKARPSDAHAADGPPNSMH